MGGGTGERGRKIFPRWNCQLTYSIASVSHGDMDSSRYTSSYGVFLVCSLQVESYCSFLSVI